MTEEEERYRRGQRFVMNYSEVEVFDTVEEAHAFRLEHSRRMNRRMAELGRPPMYPEVEEEA